MHVIGFDVEEVDVSQLECAAQVGEGLYLGASDADGLASALEQTVTATAELPSSRLSIEALID